MRVAVAVFAIALIVVPVASADGDPASDYLIAQDTFVPYPAPDASAVAGLNGAVAGVWAHGDRLKVAVIASQQDLGSIPSIFGQPVAYGRFLGAELKFVYTGPLLIAMPAGFGFVRNALPVPAAQTLLDRMTAGRDATSLTTSATAAVRALETAGLLHVKDVTRPAASVQPEHAFRGRRVLLRYSLSDDSRSARADLTVRTAAGATIKAFHQPFQHALPASSYGVVWRVPSSAPRQLVLCVHATDHAGNRSRTVCAALTLA